MDEQRKTGGQGPRKPGVLRGDNKRPYHGPQQAVSAQRNDRQPAEKGRDDHPMKGKGPSPNVVCFRCQGKGHFANSPICPMYGKGGGDNRQLRDRPQLKAARVPEVDSSDGALDDHAEEAGSTDDWDDGSQWESASEGDASLHSHEDSPRVNRISIVDILSDPEDDDWVYVRAARERVVAM